MDCVICQLDGLLGEWLSETLESETLECWEQIVCPVS